MRRRGWLYWMLVAIIAIVLFSVGDAGPGLAILLVIGAVWAWRRTAPAVAKPDGVAVPGPANASDVSGAPTGKPVPTAERKITRLSSQGRVGVVGEHYRQPALKRVVGRRRVAPAGSWDAGLRVAGYLVREPSNKHDRNAVMVQVAHNGATEHIGYLSAELAPRWQPLLRSLEAQGRVAECPCYIYRGGDGEFMAVLRLADPEEALLDNAEPDGALLLEAERSCALARESDHQDVLGAYQPGLYWATLHPGTVTSGKYAGRPTVEAHLDGRRVGEMSAVQGARYGELLQADGTVACEARVYDGTRYREVQLMLPKVD